MNADYRSPEWVAECVPCSRCDEVLIEQDVVSGWFRLNIICPACGYWVLVDNTDSEHGPVDL